MILMHNEEREDSSKEVTNIRCRLNLNDDDASFNKSKLRYGR